MKNVSERTAKTVDAAIELALDDLQIDEADALIEVLDEGEAGGLLGFGRRPARVRVSRADASPEEIAAELEGDAQTSLDEENAADSYATDSLDEDEEPGYDAEAETDEEAAEGQREENYGGRGERRHRREATRRERSREGHSERGGRGERWKYREHRVHASEEPMTPEQEALEQKAVDFVTAVLKQLDIHGRMTTYYGDDDNLHIEVTGDDVGNAIGRHGETLEALQYLTSLVINRDRESYQRLIIDIDHYRERRSRQLRFEARKNAERVLRSGRRYVMEAMSPSERRIVHLALADMAGVVTYSEGEEPHRAVVIALDDGEAEPEE